MNPGALVFPDRHTLLLVVLPIALAVALLLSLFLKRRRTPLSSRGRAVGLYRILGAVILLGTAATPRPNMSMHLPAQEFTRLNGSPVRLDSYRGKPVVINLWASWCAPCRREMPLLVDEQRRHPGVTFVFVNQGESLEDVTRFLAGIEGRVVNVALDERKTLMQLAGVAALPATLFFGSDGQLRTFHVGELSRAALLRYVESASDK